MNQEIYDLVHPDDAEKIRDQLSATESPDAGRVLDLKSELFVLNWSLFPVYQAATVLLPLGEE